MNRENDDAPARACGGGGWTAYAYRHVVVVCPVVHRIYTDLFGGIVQCTRIWQFNRRAREMYVKK